VSAWCDSTDGTSPCSPHPGKHFRKATTRLIFKEGKLKKENKNFLSPFSSSKTKKETQPID
jgi:hypothetical protein